MLNEAEKRILHGLYVDLGVVDGYQTYRLVEAAWLLNCPYSKAESWRGTDGQFKQITSAADSPLHQIEISRTAQALSHLAGAGLIVQLKPFNYGPLRQIAMTYQGAVAARSLATWYGRIGFWYRERKDGLIGLVITVAVSIATTLLTLLIKHELSGSVSDSPPTAARAAPRSPAASPPSPRRRAPHQPVARLASGRQSGGAAAPAHSAPGTAPAPGRAP